MTQTSALLRYLRLNPGASSLEITMDLGIVNTTGRISDLRARDHVIECRRRADKRQGYWLVETAQMELAL